MVRERSNQVGPGFEGPRKPSRETPGTKELAEAGQKLEEADKKIPGYSRRFNAIWEQTEKEILKRGLTPEQLSGGKSLQEVIKAAINERIKEEVAKISSGGETKEQGDIDGNLAALAFKFLEIIRKEKLDRLSGLERRGSFYELAQEATQKAVEGQKLENAIHAFRYAGDEFTALITTEDGKVVTFFVDLAYLNRFNDIGGHDGGDRAIEQTGLIVKRAMDRFEADFFNRGLSELEMAEKFKELLAQESEKADLPKQYKDKGLNVELDLGAATLDEAADVYKGVTNGLKPEDLKRDYPEDRKINRLADFMVRVADRRSEEAKARDRVWELVEQSARVSSGLMSKDDFQESLKFSLKGMAGVTEDVLPILAKISDPVERFKAIEELVTKGFDKKDKIRTEISAREPGAVSGVARRAIRPFLRNVPKSLK